MPLAFPVLQVACAEHLRPHRNVVAVYFVAPLRECLRHPGGTGEAIQHRSSPRVLGELENEGNQSAFGTGVLDSLGGRRGQRVAKYLWLIHGDRQSLWRRRDAGVWWPRWTRHQVVPPKGNHSSRPTTTALRQPIAKSPLDQTFPRGDSSSTLALRFARRPRAGAPLRRAKRAGPASAAGR